MKEGIPTQIRQLVAAQPPGLADLLGSAGPRRAGGYVTGSGRIASGACSAGHASATASTEATEDAGGDE
jgi:hypothetical protein